MEGHIYIGGDVKNALATLLKERIELQKTDFLLHFKKKCYKTMTALVATANAIQKKDLSKLSNKELTRLFGYFATMYQNAGCFVAIFPSIGNQIEKIVIEKLKEQNIPNPEERIYLLTFPKKENEEGLCFFISQ